MSKEAKTEIRVRFAPSPTGWMTVGNARTALFNYLFAQKNKGKFVLRIEDTDKERSERKYEEDVLEGLKWLGIEWDEGPYRQSERLETYRRYLEKLLKDGHAYYCFCTEEELEAMRQDQMSRGEAPRYNGKCAALSQKESGDRISKGEPSVIRFRTANKKIAFTDMVRKQVEFDTSLFGDFVIAKNLDAPLYNFAVIIDDYEMKISHVIRGEDHISNTPRQLLIQEALGFPRPENAHIPLLLGSDRSKLSKRHGTESLREYREAGYLPEAMFNFLALLGWHPADNQEIFSEEELISAFSLERVQKGGAIFDLEKLNWINKEHIKRLPIRELMRMLSGFMPERWNKSAVNFEKLVNLSRERISKLSEFKEVSDFFFELPDYPPKLLLWKGKEDPRSAKKHLAEIKELIGAVSEDDFSKKKLEKLCLPYAEKEGRGGVLWPFRVSLSGKEASPGPFEIAEILGKNETLRRVERAVERAI